MVEDKTPFLRKESGVFCSVIGRPGRWQKARHDS